MYEVLRYFTTPTQNALASKQNNLTTVDNLSSLSIVQNYPSPRELDARLPFAYECSSTEIFPIWITCGSLFYQKKMCLISQEG